MCLFSKTVSIIFFARSHARQINFKRWIKWEWNGYKRTQMARNHGAVVWIVNRTIWLCSVSNLSSYNSHYISDSHDFTVALQQFVFFLSIKMWHCGSTISPNFPFVHIWLIDCWTKMAPASCNKTKLIFVNGEIPMTIHHNYYWHKIRIASQASARHSIRCSLAFFPAVFLHPLKYCCSHTKKFTMKYQMNIICV